MDSTSNPSDDDVDDHGMDDDPPIDNNYAAIWHQSIIANAIVPSVDTSEDSQGQ